MNSKTVYVAEYQNNWTHIFNTLEEAIEELHEVLDEDEIDDDYEYPGGQDKYGNTFQIHSGDYYANGK